MLLFKIVEDLTGERESKFCEYLVGWHGMQNLLHLSKHVESRVVIFAKRLYSNELSACTMAYIAEKHI